jgi:hypothetical protein
MGRIGVTAIDRRQMSRETDKLELAQAKHGDVLYLNWVAEGGAQIYVLNDVYVWFDIPMYGGEPRYQRTFYDYEVFVMLEEIYSYT